MRVLKHRLQFPPNPNFPSNPAAAHESFQTHADITVSAFSQALVGFFHSTGYRSVVPADQAMAQLYLTFAAHGNHKGAQMALGYRYWSGIGVDENCMAALNWYEDAAEEGARKSHCPVEVRLSSFPSQRWQSSCQVLSADGHFLYSPPDYQISTEEYTAQGLVLPLPA